MGKGLTMSAHDARPGFVLSSQSIFNVISLLSILVVGGAFLWNVAFEWPSARRLAQERERLAQSQVGLPSEPITLEGTVVRGDPTAKIALIVFSDFQCPFCGKLARDTFPALEDHFVRQGKVLVAFRQFPLEVIHPFAGKAAEAVECAGRQGKFWQMHDLLFQDQKHLDESSLRQRAQNLGLDRAQFASCLGGQATATIHEDIDMANSLHITSTPTILIGIIQPDGRVKVTRRFAGVPQFKQIEDEFRILAQENVTSVGSNGTVR
jgi:protein-disulfide isomerase